MILFLSEPEIEPAGASHVTRMEKAEVGLAVRLAGAWGTSTSCCVVTVITCNDEKDNDNDNAEKVFQIQSSFSFKEASEIAERKAYRTQPER